MKAAGATIIDPIALPDFNGQRLPESLSGRGIDMNQYLASFPSVHPDMKSLCRSGRWRALGGSVAAGPIPAVSGFEAVCLAVYDSAYQDQAAALRKFQSNRVYVEGVMNAQRLDALLYPTDPVGKSRDNNDSSNCLASAVSGMPAFVIQTGYTAGTPPSP
jgi:hypothetical protein